jgi:hypothetical protein
MVSNNSSRSKDPSYQYSHIQTKPIETTDHSFPNTSSTPTIENKPLS